MRGADRVDPGGQDESFIPFSMIEPLLEEGMTGSELVAKLDAVSGLDDRFVYELATAGMPLREALRFGVTVKRREQSGPRRRADEPVR